MAELTIRDWMVIAGALLILAVLLDAWRRVYQDRRSEVRMKLAPSGKDEDTRRREREVDLAWLRELPNGGARVVARGEEVGGNESRGADAAGEAEAGDGQSPKPAPAAPRPPEPPRSAESRPVKPAHASRPDPRPEPVPEPEPEAAPPQDEVDLVTGVTGTDEPENLDWLDALEAEQKKSQAPAASDGKAQLPRDVEPEVFMLNVVARNHSGFRGEDILHILLACDLRFGDMSFFHRHEQEAGRGPIQFSVANMMQPGMFDIDNMSDFTTPGLVFFVTLPGPENMMQAFDYMLETAQAVARNLGGDVLDETRSVLTRQTLEHARQQIRDLERRLLAKAR